jgi:hypothetical protein
MSLRLRSWRDYDLDSNGEVSVALWIYPATVLQFHFHPDMDSQGTLSNLINFFSKLHIELFVRSTSLDILKVTVIRFYRMKHEILNADRCMNFNYC